MQFPFCGPTYASASIQADSQRAINLFPEVVESGAGKSKQILLGTPGLQTFCTLPQSPTRALYASARKELYAVAGTGFYQIFADGSYVYRGDVGDTPNHYPAQILSNGSQLLIVSTNVVGGVGIVGRAYYDIGAGPVVATFADSTDQVSAWRGAFLDGYFIVADEWGSRNFHISGLYDATAWDALDFGVKEAHEDNIYSILADHEELWLFGDGASTEVWQNTGNPDFPFQRNPGAVMHFGIAAPFTPARVGTGVAWLTSDRDRGGPMAVLATGFQPQRISNHAVENIWRTFSSVRDAVAYSYVEAGHQFYVITFPSADQTWAYDAATGLWHERAYWTGSAYSRARQAFHAYGELGAYGPVGNLEPAHFVGDWQTGNIYRMSREYTTDAGTAIHWQRTAPHISDNQARAVHSRLRVACENGLGSPVLDWSNNGGRTYTVSPKAPHLTGDGYVEWRRLGQARDRVYRLAGTGGGKSVALIDGYLEVSGGTS